MALISLFLWQCFIDAILFFFLTVLIITVFSLFCSLNYVCFLWSLLFILIFFSPGVWQVLIHIFNEGSSRFTAGSSRGGSSTTSSFPEWESLPLSIWAGVPPAGFVPIPRNPMSRKHGSYEGICLASALEGVHVLSLLGWGALNLLTFHHSSHLCSFAPTCPQCFCHEN